MLKTAIYGTSYIIDQRRQDVVRLWIRLAARLNPGFPLAIIDSASPVPVPDECGVEIIQLGDNLGHLAAGGGDGWGRAMCHCLDMAVERELDYIAIVDTDIVLACPIGSVFDYMRANNWKICMPVGDTYPWPENGLMFMDVAWVKESKFVEKYDWRGSTFNRIPEWHCLDIIGRDIKILEMPGRRNDNGDATSSNLRQLYPNGCGWLTHCVNTAPYETLLRMNGIKPEEVGWEELCFAS